MTSDRVCCSQPSIRSPRTAWQAGAAGVPVHICTGDTCARTKLELTTNAPKREEENLFHHWFMRLSSTNILEIKRSLRRSLSILALSAGRGRRDGRREPKETYVP